MRGAICIVIPPYHPSRQRQSRRTAFLLSVCKPLVTMEAGFTIFILLHIVEAAGVLYSDESLHLARYT